eukprot:g11063.t1
MLSLSGQPLSVGDKVVDGRTESETRKPLYQKLAVVTKVYNSGMVSVEHAAVPTRLPLYAPPTSRVVHPSQLAHVGEEELREIGYVRGSYDQSPRVGGSDFGSCSSQQNSSSLAKPGTVGFLGAIAPGTVIAVYNASLKRWCPGFVLMNQQSPSFYTVAAFGKGYHMFLPNYLPFPNQLWRLLEGIRCLRDKRRFQPGDAVFDATEHENESGAGPPRPPKAGVLARLSSSPNRRTVIPYHSSSGAASKEDEEISSADVVIAEWGFAHGRSTQEEQTFAYMSENARRQQLGQQKEQELQNQKKAAVEEMAVAPAPPQPRSVQPQLVDGALPQYICTLRQDAEREEYLHVLECGYESQQLGPYSADHGSRTDDVEHEDLLLSKFVSEIDCGSGVWCQQSDEVRDREPLLPCYRFGPPKAHERDRQTQEDKAWRVAKAFHSLNPQNSESAASGLYLKAIARVDSEFRNEQLRLVGARQVFAEMIGRCFSCADVVDLKLRLVPDITAAARRQEALATGAVPGQQNRTSAAGVEKMSNQAQLQKISRQNNGPAEAPSAGAAAATTNKPDVPSLFSIRNNDCDVAAPSPDRWTAKADRQLRPEQLRALTWMLARERDDREDGHPVRVRQSQMVDIADVDGMDERSSSFSSAAAGGGRPAVTGSATSQKTLEPIRKNAYGVEFEAVYSYTIRGGILADKVGHGKTATMLGLIAAQDEHYSVGSESAGKPPQRPALPPIPEHDRGKFFDLPSTTLVLVPRHLVDQWAEEVKKFVADDEQSGRGLRKWKVITMKTVKELASKTPADLAEYDLVISTYQLLYSQKYSARVCDFLENDPEGGPENLEAVQQKISRPASGTGSVASYPLQPLKRSTAALIRAFDADASTLADRDPFVKSRIFKESDVLSAAVLKKKCTVKKLKTKATSAADVPFPVFEQLFFRRVVLDEFHETEALTGRTNSLMWIRGRFKWGLTGTPCVGSVGAVKTMAGLFGVDLLCNGLSTKNTDAAWFEADGPQKKLKAFEKKPPPHGNDERGDNPNAIYRGPCASRVVWENCQQFVDKMLRQNSKCAAVERIKVVSHSIPVQQSAAEQLLYNCARQRHERTLGVDFSLRDNCTEGTLRACEELVKLCSHFAVSSSSSTNEPDEIRRKRNEVHRQVSPARKALAQALRWLELFRRVSPLMSAGAASTLSRAVIGRLGGGVSSQGQSSCVELVTPQSQDRDGISIFPPAFSLVAAGGAGAVENRSAMVAEAQHRNKNSDTGAARGPPTKKRRGATGKAVPVDAPAPDLGNAEPQTETQKGQGSTFELLPVSLRERLGDLAERFSADDLFSTDKEGLSVHEPEPQHEHEDHENRPRKLISFCDIVDSDLLDSSFTSEQKSDVAWIGEEIELGVGRMYEHFKRIFASQSLAAKLSSVEVAGDAKKKKGGTTSSSRGAPASPAKQQNKSTATGSQFRLSEKDTQQLLKFHSEVVLPQLTERLTEFSDRMRSFTFLDIASKLFSYDCCGASTTASATSSQNTMNLFSSRSTAPPRCYLCGESQASAAGKSLRFGVTQCGHVFCSKCVSGDDVKAADEATASVDAGGPPPLAKRKTKSCPACDAPMPSWEPPHLFSAPPEAEIRAYRDREKLQLLMNKTSPSAGLDAAAGGCAQKKKGSSTVISGGASASTSSNFVVVPGAGFDHFGSKIEAVCRTLKNIKSTDPTSKAIVYVQFSDLAQKLGRAFRAYSFNYKVLGRGNAYTQNRILHSFQNDAPIVVSSNGNHGKSSSAGAVTSSESPDILVMSLETAASGATLHRASHVLLVAPMVAETGERSAAFEEQALGRVRRLGQVRPEVHLWRFYAIGTVEESRRERDLYAPTPAGR